MAVNLTDINTKLVDISTQYSKFNKNQVLTERQLNAFLDYFDDQDRLTRTSLSGVGIVCGFKVIYNAEDHTIQITQGRGVTTDGDLVALQKQSETEAGQNDTTLKSIDLSSKTYSFYKLFTDNKAQYKHFVKPDKTVINMWELHEQDADTHTSLSELPDLSNMVALLYLESYSKEGDLCTQLTCDNQGIEQVARLRVLLVSSQNAQYIIGNDPIFKGNDWYETYLGLREVSAKRVVLNTNNTKTNTQLKKNYFDVIKGTNTLQYLGESLDTIYEKFGQSPVSHLIHQLFNFEEAKTPTDFQYRYDLLKDFIDTYNEIKALLLDLNVDCCPDIGSFPKHLMLGRLVETAEYETFRHSFYKSPIIAAENEKYRNVLSLLKKIKQLAEEYKLLNKGEEIKITPSLTQAELSEKSIPFYYNVTDSFLEQWSVKTSKYLRKRYNLSYHTENLANVPSVRNPLDYNLDPFDFYRIEGHQGKQYRDALDKITQLKEEHGLSFDVKVLSIETDKESVDLTEYKCQFEDLTVLLDAWRAEQDCVLAETIYFLSGFSIENPGDHTSSQRKNLDDKREKEKEEDVDVRRMEANDMILARLHNRYASNGGRQNLVLVNANTSEEALGGRVIDIITKLKNATKSDIQLGLKDLEAEVSQNDGWSQDRDLSKFILNDVAQLLVLIYVLDNLIPNRITEINENSLAAYKNSVDQLCVQVTLLQRKYEALNLTQETKQSLGLLFGQLSTVCCSAKKLEVLYQEIQSRQDHILKQTQLCEFVKNHPGLEHKAGVVPGGTFVMVYLKEAEQSEPTYPNVILEIPFLQLPQVLEGGLGGEGGKIELWEGRFSTEFIFVSEITAESDVPMDRAVPIGETIEETVTSLANFLNVHWENADGADKLEAEANGNILVISIKDRSVPEQSFYMQFENSNTVGQDADFFFDANEVLEANVTTRNTVIADFSLPYMCCSDCSPINFIIPAEPISLSLPVSYICLKDGEDVIPIPFDVSPSDGEIKANVDPAKPSGLTTDANGNPVFDASLMHESLYGQEISFTVNDEETDCRITVYEDVPLSVTTTETYDEMHTTATVLYEVSNRYQNLSYSWDFGNGEAYDEMPNADRIVEKVYKLSLLDSRTITPSLTVSNGFCEKEVPIDPITFEELTEVRLEIAESYCFDISSGVPGEVPFTEKEPANAQIEIVDGVQGLSIENDQLIIDPNDFQSFNTPIRFTLGGQSTGAQIVIGATFQVEVTENSGAFNWVNNVLHYRYDIEAALPANVDVGSATFNWRVGPEDMGVNENAIQVNLPVNRDGTTTDIVVEVSFGGPCVSTGDISVGIDYPNFRLRMPRNKLNYCFNDGQAHLISVNPDISGTLVEGDGVFYDDNNNPRFRATDRATQNGGEVELSIAGETLLTLTIKDAPEASFSARVDRDQLKLTNTSDEADAYKWNVGGILVEREDKQDESIPLSRLDGDFINISLEVFGECGSDTFEILEFKIKEGTTTDDNKCVETVLTGIKTERKRLPKEEDINIQDRVQLATVRLYDVIIAGTPEVQTRLLTSGEITPEFVKSLTDLYTNTKNEILESVNKPERVEELSNYLIAQTKFFFFFMHCQPERAYEENKDRIDLVFSSLTKNFTELKGGDIQFDKGDNLQSFLTNYTNDPQVQGAIKGDIENKLLPALRFD